MRKILLLLLCLLFLGSHQVFAQAVGDYGAVVNNGTWTVAGTWLKWNGTAFATSTASAPGLSDNVYIPSGMNVNIDVANGNCKNLFVLNGGSIVIGGGTTNTRTLTCAGNIQIDAGSSFVSNTNNNASSSLSVISMTAINPTVTVNGNIGNDLNGLYLRPNASSASTMTITGSTGVVKLSAITSQKANQTTVFDINTTLTYNSIALGGGQFDGSVITINTGKTVNVINGSVSVGNSASSDPTGGSAVFNINGTLNISGATGSQGLNMKTFTGKTSTLNVSGTLIIKTNFYTTLTTPPSGTVNINVATGGSVSFLAASSTCEGANGTTVMNGTWDFTNTIAGTRSLGNATVGGKLILPDATFPTGITLGSGSQVEYKGSSSYTLPAALTTYYGLTINNSAGVTLGASTNILESLTVTSGAISLGNNDITLKSSASGTAYFAATAVAAPFTYNGTGLFVCEKYISGGGSGFPVSGNSKRGYRFVGHPLNAATSLGQIIGASEIAVTGSGGSANGFITTGTNNPSAFSYNPNAVNAGTVSGISSGGSGPSDPGWTAFTDATTSNWGVGQGIRVFYRGSAAQGLTSADYTVGSATIDFKGQLNVGGATGLDVNLINGVTTYNLVGNPFASPVNLKNVARTNVSNFVYVFKADQGNRGGYGTVDVSADYLLPAYAGFFAQATGASPKLTFEEADKATTQTADVLFRNNTANNSVKFKLVDANTFWDELEIRMDNNELSAYNNHDAAKFFNPDVNFYSISADSKYLSIDSRNNKDIVPLGLMTATARTFTLKVDAYNMQQGTELYLVDKFLQTETKIDAGMEYSFSTNSNAASQGDNRFEIARKISIPVVSLQPSFTVKAYPNPITDKLQISFNGTSTEENTAIRIVNANGTVLQTIDAGKVASGIQSIPTKGWANGTYQVQLVNGKQVQIQSIIKQ